MLYNLPSCKPGLKHIAASMDVGNMAGSEGDLLKFSTSEFNTIQIDLHVVIVLIKEIVHYGSKY